MQIQIFFTRAGIKLAVETGMQWYSKGAKKSKYLHRQQQHTFSVTEWFANAGLTDSLLDEAVSKCDEQSVETSEQLRSLQHKGRISEEKCSIIPRKFCSLQLSHGRNNLVKGALVAFSRSSLIQRDRSLPIRLK